MSDQALELVIKARDESSAAFKSLDKSMEGWTASQQKAAQKMEALHERALKLNQSFKPLTDNTEKNAAALRTFASALPIQQTEAMTGVLNLASVGFKNLNTSMAGFNAQSAGVAAAALAIGYAIGSWADRFEPVQHAVDSLRDSLVELVFQGLITTAAQDQAKAMEGISNFQKEMAKSNDEATARQVAGMKAQGKSLQEIAEFYKSNNKLARTARDLVIEGAEAEKKALAATKAHSAELKQMAAEAKQRHEEAMRRQHELRMNIMGASLGPAGKAIAGGMEDMLRQMSAGIEHAVMDLPIGKNLGKLLGEQMGGKSTFYPYFREGFRGALKQSVADLPNVILGAIQGGGNVGQAIGASLGANIGKGLEKPITDSLTNVLGKTLGGALGSLAPGLGALLGGLGGKLLGGLFGGSEEKKVNPLRQKFIDAAGGLAELNQKAAAAGLTLDRLLDAKTVKEYDAAIAQLTGRFDLQAQSQQALQASIDKYGITISELGPKFAQQKLDEQAHSLEESWKLLHAAGVSYETLVQKMGPDFQAYVQQVIASGGTIPESLHAAVDQLIQMGALVDENGQAFENTKDAGINFAESVTDAIDKLVDALNRVFGFDGREINIPVNFQQGGGGGGGEHSRAGEGMAAGGMVTGWGVPAVLHGTSSNPEHAVREDRLLDVVRRAIETSGGYNAGGGNLYVSSGPTYQDGQMVAKATMRRIDLNKARSKGALRGRAR